jgi:hypothetical protein
MLDYILAQPMKQSSDATAVKGEPEKPKRKPRKEKPKPQAEQLTMF